MNRRRTVLLLMLALAGRHAAVAIPLPLAHHAVVAESAEFPGDQHVAAFSGPADLAPPGDLRRSSAAPTSAVAKSVLRSPLRPQAAALLRLPERRDPAVVTLYRHRARRDPGDPPH